jgi:hypothetical protein
MCTCIKAVLPIPLSTGQQHLQHLHRPPFVHCFLCPCCVRMTIQCNATLGDALLLLRCDLPWVSGQTRAGWAEYQLARAPEDHILRGARRRKCHRHAGGRQYVAAHPIFTSRGGQSGFMHPSQGEHAGRSRTMRACNVPTPFIRVVMLGMVSPIVGPPCRHHRCIATKLAAGSTFKFRYHARCRV